MEVTMVEPGEILPERNVDMAALYDMLQQSKASAEEIVAKMLAIKKEAEPKSQLRELVTQILLNFVTLRQANRSILLEEDRVKAETERAKAPVDFTTLQLHNLMYEKNHYVKAIKACKDFKTKYPDIELVPEEEFIRDAPEEIKSSALSTDSAHDLMLKRLNYELLQRKELCNLRDKLELQKKALQETIANRKKFLSSLPSHLKALKKASLPVQHQLGVLHTKKLKQQQLAELLPPPLYVIYSQLLAQKEAFGENIELEITGSVKDAQAFARQIANKNSAMSTNLENPKLEDDAPDEEDDGQRRRKRPKKVPSKDHDQSGIYENHPLKVTLHINDDEASDSNLVKLITLKFEFLVKLNIVCVGVEGSEEFHQDNILCNLFPDDTGLELPQQSAKLFIGNSLLFDERRTARPYKWVQHLAGIDFLPEVSPLVAVSEDSNGETNKHASILSGLSVYRQQNRVETVVQRIRARKKAQLALAELLGSLKKLTWPTLTCKSVPWASHTPRCKLHGWLSTTSVGNNSTTSHVTDVERVHVSTNTDASRKSGTSKEMETTTEDGELPSLVSVTNGVNDVKLTPSKGIEMDHSRRLSLISKSIVSPISKGKSPSFKKPEEDVDLLLESENELDEPVQVEETSDNALPLGELKNSWADCGVHEYSLVLIRKLDKDERIMKLEAKIKISAEYPLRPPHFGLCLYSSLQGENSSVANGSEWYNELRAMELEVNVHIVRMITWSEDNLVLGHQVLCLAMLFDLFLENWDLSSEKRKCTTSVIDVGLCKPVSGGLVTRSFRGRDRRKMISWKDNICSPGYPC
ncbi:hypothetical protein BUALT_Bualt08G0050100 [Buddleja alternifolia]|uniref:THO complex subunit 5 n=1 Tax=Buddleja alternifolia TaxID=168488 RepID=A0AAV6XB15_9LAMI|nr:hypothetical protein BUALT_Bualt08G0050100 [Buddleja alternifolia]